MPDPQTPNLGLFVPLNGADVATWDVPMNANWNLLDSVLGGAVSVALSNVPVTLSAAQYNASIITFTGTLTGNVVVTFPAVGRIYTLYNSCVGNTSFYVIAKTAAGATQASLPPNEPVTVLCDGSNMRFVSLERIGTYWDFAGASVPLWVTTSVPAPYLNCDGTAFSSATYPALRDYLGGTTLPDARGRFRAALNQGTARLSAINGNTLLSSGGSEIITQANVPSYNLSGGNHLHTDGYQNAGLAAGGDFLGPVIGPPFTNTTQSANITIASGGSGTAYVPPAYVGGLTLIRAG